MSQKEPLHRAVKDDHFDVLVSFNRCDDLIQLRANKIDHRRSQMESPIEVVRRFCAAWSDNIGAAELAAFFTDDAVYHNIPLAPVTGREAIANNIASFIRPGAPGIEGIQFRVINIAANGPVVMTERVDVFKLPDKNLSQNLRIALGGCKWLRAARSRGSSWGSTPSEPVAG